MLSRLTDVLASLSELIFDGFPISRYRIHCVIRVLLTLRLLKLNYHVEPIRFVSRLVQCFKWRSWIVQPTD